MSDFLYKILMRWVYPLRVKTIRQALYGVASGRGDRQGGGSNQLSLGGNADNKRMLVLQKIASLIEYLTKDVHPFRSCAKLRFRVATEAEMVGCEF